MCVRLCLSVLCLKFIHVCVLFVLWIFKHVPWHDISNSVVCAASKGSDQPAHMCSLIRAFASGLNILWLLSFWSNAFRVSKPKRKLHRLVWVHTCQNATFLEIRCCDLTIYSIVTPFDTFEISCIWKYYGKWSFCSFGANTSFSIIFSKVYKTLLKFFLNFSMLSKNRKWCHDLKIAYWGKGWICSRRGLRHKRRWCEEDWCIG